MYSTKKINININIYILDSERKDEYISALQCIFVCVSITVIPFGVVKMFHSSILRLVSSNKLDLVVIFGIIKQHADECNIHSISRFFLRRMLLT